MNRQFFATMCYVFLIAFSATRSSHATQFTLRPSEAGSQDTYLYENFANTPMFNNGNLGTIAGFTGTLGVSKTTSNPANHNTLALLAFDLSPLAGVDPNDVVAVSLKLTSAPGLSFYQAPSAAFPATLEAYANTTAWSEAAVNWNSRPTAAVTLLGSQSISGDGQLLTFSSLNLTNLVKSWLSTPGNNFGFQLVQALEVNNGNGRVGITLFSADDATVANRPVLEITTVPEPGSLVLTLLGLVGVFGMRRRLRR